MNAQKISKEAIIHYYDSTEFDYKLFWDLNHSYAMHFGYWDEKVKNFPQALQRENEILAEKANIKNSDNVLDAGCGVGGSSLFLAKKYGCNVTGITLSKKQVITASKHAQKQKVAKKTKFIAMDFEKMTFPDETFDVVWAIESVCHADSKKKFIEESYRVLKKGGRLIVADAFLTKKHFTLEEKTILQRFLSGWGVNFLETQKNFAVYLNQARFTKISFTDSTSSVMPSSIRLYKYASRAMLLGKIADLIKLRSKTQTGNIIAAYYQHKALKRGLGNYGFFYAEKPI